jgi:hypothetical protein
MGGLSSYISACSIGFAGIGSAGIGSAGIDTTPRARSVVGWCPGSDPIGLATAMWSVDVRPAAGGVEAPTAGPDGLVGTLRDPLAEENRTHVRLN